MKLPPNEPQLAGFAAPRHHVSTVRRPPPMIGSFDELQDNQLRHAHAHEAQHPPANMPMQTANSSDVLAQIQGKVRELAVIAHIALGEPELAGIAKVQMILDRYGYVDGWRMVQSAGDRRLDHEVHDVLHMDEPYAYVSGWFEIEVPFYRRAPKLH